MSDINMSVNIAGVELKNPVTVASGTFGSGMEYGEYVDLNRLGAVTTKGVANIPWPGNPTPRIAETYGGMMNAIGLQNPGLDTFVKRDIPFLKQYDTKIIVNVCGKSEAGGEAVYFLANEKWWRPVFYFISRWKETGWGTIIFIAALMGIDQEMYEAAKIDGATRPQQIWYITIPAIRGD